jgi:hypothetical protein
MSEQSKNLFVEMDELKGTMDRTAASLRKTAENLQRTADIYRANAAALRALNAKLVEMNAGMRAANERFQAAVDRMNGKPAAVVDAPVSVDATSDVVKAQAIAVSGLADSNAAVVPDKAINDLAIALVNAALERGEVDQTTN